MYQCRFCGFHSDNLDDFEEDFQFHKGFWYPYCDGFTYFDKTDSEHSFFLLLEDKRNVSDTNYSKTVTFPTAVSPLRYPGGKSKFVSQVYEKCRMEHMKNFIEPFAGGASVGLSLLLSGNIQELWLNDLDYGIYSFFQTIKFFPEALISRIMDFNPTEKAYYESRDIVSSNYKGLDIFDAAWSVFIVNRLAFSGICKANCMKNIKARWNPKTLCKRIQNIAACSTHIHISNINALEYIEEMYWKPDSTMFIDPPYFVKGKDLYHCYYERDDHLKLASLLDNLYKGMPGSDMIVTYDMSEYIKSIYDYPIAETVSRKYSIAN